MLELLQNIAFDNSLTFAFGDLFDLNNYAETVAEDSPKVLFYDCYYGFTINENTANGSLTRSPRLSVFILSPSNLTDEPERRLSQINACADIAVNVFKTISLTGNYTLTGARVDPIITKTDRELDGVQLTATITTNPEGIC